MLAVAAELAAGNAGATTADDVRAELVRLAASDDLTTESGALLDRLAAALLVVTTVDGRVHVPGRTDRRACVPRLGDDLPSAAELAAPAPPRARHGRRDRPQHPRTTLVRGRLRHRRGDRRTPRRTRYAARARTGASGGLALPDSKRLAEASGTALEDLPRLFHRADEAGLVAREGAFWLESDHGATWALESAKGRWLRLAECWRDRIPAPLRDLVARRTRHPHRCGTARRRALATTRRAGTGSTTASTGCSATPRRSGSRSRANPSRPGGSCSPASSTRPPTGSRRTFPHEVDQVYLQHDLTIVVARPPRTVARRATARDRRRRGPRARLDLPRQRGIRQPRTRGRRNGRDDPRVPQRTVAHRHPAAARVPDRRDRRAVRRRVRVGRRRRVGCPGEGVDPLRRRRSSCARSPSTSRSRRSGCVSRARTGCSARFDPDVRVLGAHRRALPGRRRGRRRQHRAAAPAPARARRPSSAVKADPITALLDRVLERAGAARRPSRRGSPDSSRRPRARRRRSP